MARTLKQQYKQARKAANKASRDSYFAYQYSRQVDSNVWATPSERASAQREYATALRNLENANSRASAIKSKMRANRAAGLRDLPGSAIRTVQFALTGQKERATRAGGFVKENLRVIRTGSPARGGGRGASDASRV